MITVLRPLSTSELLDRTFHLYRNHFVMFAGITAITQIPVLTLHVLDAALWLTALIATRGLRMLLFVAVSLLGLEVAHAATAVALSRLHLGGSTSIKGAYSSAKGSLLRVIWIVFVTFLLPMAAAIVLGFISVGVAATGLDEISGSGFRVAVIFVVVFLAAPILALRWLLAWSLVVPITVLEGGGLRATIRRSRKLTAGRRGRILAIYLLIFLLTYAVAVLFQVPYFILVGGRAFSTHPGHQGTLRVMVSAIGTFLSTSFVGPLLEIAFTLIYYDERVRKEGFDLQLMMLTLEGGTATAVTVSAS